MRIACLFGSFDPPHRGHLAIAEHMLKACDLEQVWLVVTPQNPFKQDRSLSPDQHRLAMVRLAVQGKDALVASGFELDLPRPSYTADSLRFMRHRWPDHEFALIVGSDNLADLHPLVANHPRVDKVRIPLPDANDLAQALAQLRVEHPQAFDPASGDAQAAAERQRAGLRLRHLRGHLLLADAARHSRDRRDRGAP